MFVALLWHPDGDIGAAVLDMTEPQETLSVCVISSRATDGRVFGTSNERRIFNYPAQFLMEYHFGKPAEWLLQRHRDRMADAEEAGVKWKVFTREEGPTRSIQYDAVLRDDFLERGVFVELDELWDAKREH